MMKTIMVRKIWSLLLLAVFLAGFLFILGILFPPRQNIVIIGLDGVSPEIVQDMMAQGELPNLAMLAKRGCFSRFRTHPYSLTWLIWPIIHTGIGPDSNGIDIATAENYRVNGVPLPPLRVPAIWDLVAAEGKESALIEVYGTRPVYKREHITQLSDGLRGMNDEVWLDENNYNSSATRDWVLQRKEIAQKHYWAENTLRYVLDPQFLNADNIGNPKRIRKLVDLLDHELLFEAAVSESAALQDNELLVAYFKGTDSMGHHTNTNRTETPDVLGSKALREMLRMYDVVVGRIVAASAPGSMICVVSDHGFDAVPSRTIRFDFSPGVGEAREFELKELALSGRFHDQPFYNSVRLMRGYLEVEINTALVTKGQTSAVNFLRKEKDLVIHGINYAASHNGTLGADENCSYDPENVPPVGIFFLSGPNIKSGNSLNGTTIFDVVPTLLYATGRKIPSNLEGVVLLDMFTNQMKAAHKVQYTSPINFKPPTDSTDKNTNQSILDEMRGLGYLK